MAKTEKQKKKREWPKVVLVVVLCLLLVLGALAGGFMWYSSNQQVFKKPKLLEAYPYAENQGRVLIAGSSFMENWETWQEDLAPLDAMNVAIGGTKVGHWQEMYEELIVPYNPRAIVLYVGSNDINGGSNSRAGEDVYADIVALFESLSAELPGTPVYYVSIAPTVSRESVWGDSARCNELVTAYCAENEGYHFIDVTGAYLPEGALMPEMYGFDKLHFSEAGYKVWAKVVREGLEELY